MFNTCISFGFHYFQFFLLFGEIVSVLNIFLEYFTHTYIIDRPTNMEKLTEKEIIQLITEYIPSYSENSFDSDLDSRDSVDKELWQNFKIVLNEKNDDE